MALAKLVGRLGRSSASYPDIVSLYDAHTAERHFQAVIPLRKSESIHSVAPWATPVELHRMLPARQAYVLKDVYIWADEGIITTPQGDLIAETLPSHYRFIKMLRAGAYATQILADVSPDVVDQCTSLGGGRYFGNYYHWWIDEMPRLQALHQVEDVPLVTVPSAYPEALLAVMQQLVPDGVTLQKAHGKKHWIHAKQFVFLPPVATDYCGYLPEDFIASLRRVVAAGHVRQKDVVPHRKIYVSRANATQRRILNEKAVVDLLSDRGFEVVRGEEMTLEAQIHLFSEAVCMVGAHGAGLTNMLFSSACRVIELFPGAPFTHYRWLSESLGHEYRNVVGDPTVGKHADFEVDLEKLEQVIDGA